MPFESLHDAIPDPAGSAQLKLVETNSPRVYVPPEGGDEIVATGGGVAA